MGAWIEIDGDYGTTEDNDVAPVWGRGLKFVYEEGHDCHHSSPPYGGVD